MDIFLAVACALIVILLTATVWSALRRKRPTRATPTSIAPSTIVLTTHARERMAERGVTQHEIEAVLISPTRVRRDDTQDSFRLEGDFPRGILKVWVTEWPTTEAVIVKSTAWRLTETFSIRKGSVQRVVGHRGIGVRGIEAATGARITIGKDGTVRLSAGDDAALSAARREVERAAGGLLGRRR